jgi:hypothetical protein
MHALTGEAVAVEAADVPLALLELDELDEEDALLSAARAEGALPKTARAMTATHKENTRFIITSRTST